MAFIGNPVALDDFFFCTFYAVISCFRFDVITFPLNGIRVKYSAMQWKCLFIRNYF